MGRHRRRQTEIRADEQAARRLAALGEAVRRARRRRRLTQAALAARVGVSPSTIGRIEQGKAYGLPLPTWIAVALALGLTPRFELGRDPREDVADAGHVAIQELLLRLGRRAGYTGTFELPIRPGDPARPIDVCLRDPITRRLLVLEAWNTIDDIGAGARSFDRKLAAGRELGAWLDGGDYRVAGACVVRASRRNRELVGRYPTVFESKFPGSSALWLRALTAGTEPPPEPGLVWADVRATRLFAWRRPAR